MSEDNIRYPDPEKITVKKPQCTRCGNPIRLLPAKILEKIYGEQGDVKGLSKMCPKCRRKVIWEGCVPKI